MGVRTWTEEVGGWGDGGSEATHLGLTNCTRSGHTLTEPDHELIMQGHAGIIMPLEVNEAQCVNRIFGSRRGIQTSSRSDLDTIWVIVCTYMRPRRGDVSCCSWGQRRGVSCGVCVRWWKCCAVQRGPLLI